MTPQPSEQPGTLRMVARIHPDIAAILKEPEVLTEFKRYAKHLWGSGVAIKAEAAAPDPVASPPVEALVERIRTALPRMMKAALPGAFLQADDLALGAEAAGRILDDEARRYLASATEGETAE